MKEQLFGKFLRASEAESWEKFPDFVGSTKKVGSYHVELLGGTDRGAIINIWEEGKSPLPHVWTPSDDDEWKKAAEVHFMHYLNGKDEYQNLKYDSDVLDLMWRNS